MATDSDSTSQAAPEADDFPQPDRSGPVSGLSLAGAILLAAVAPWRAFPVILRVSTGPLVAVYLAAVAGSLALTFHSASMGGWPAGMLVGQMTSLATELLGLYVLLTLSAASRRHRIVETLTVGLKLALAAKASMFLYTATAYVTMRRAGFSLSPGSIGWAAYLVAVPGLMAYMAAAMSLAAARLADREDRTETHDPLWPRCTQCDYSLRGLPLAEAWLGQRQGKASIAPTGKGEPAACPECGRPIKESLCEWDTWLAWGHKQPQGQVERAAPDRWDASTFSPWFERLMRWMVDGRRTTPVALWLAAAGILAVAILVLPDVIPPSPWLLPPAIAYVSLAVWERVLLWTGGAGLLAGLWFSLRSRHNVLWLSQHVLVPATPVTGGILLILPVKYYDVTRFAILNHLGLHVIFLLLAPLVLIVESLVLWRAGRMRSADRGR